MVDMNNHCTTTKPMCLAAVTDRVLLRMKTPEARAELVKRGLASDPQALKNRKLHDLGRRFEDEGEATRFWRRRT